ncbi:hypothetical protein GCM10010174_55020 [Kutzneria viridogrisea]
MQHQDAPSRAVPFQEEKCPLGGEPFDVVERPGRGYRRSASQLAADVRVVSLTQCGRGGKWPGGTCTDDFGP